MMNRQWLLENGIVRIWHGISGHALAVSLGYWLEIAIQCKKSL